MGHGSQGNDDIIGGATDEFLFGGGGDDILTGGGDDIFYAGAGDVIKDPEQGDRIWADLYPDDGADSYLQMEGGLGSEGEYIGKYGETYWLGDQEGPFGPDLEIRLPGGGVVLVEDWFGGFGEGAESYTNSGITLVEGGPALHQGQQAHRLRDLGPRVGGG